MHAGTFLSPTGLRTCISPQFFCHGVSHADQTARETHHVRGQSLHELSQQLQYSPRSSPEQDLKYVTRVHAASSQTIAQASQSVSGSVSRSRSNNSSRPAHWLYCS